MSNYKRDDKYEPSSPTDGSPSHGIATSGADKIDFDQYDDIPVEVSGRDTPKAITAWRDADLGEDIHRNVEGAGYKKPTPVQKNAIPIVLQGRDLMGCAQTGSGKTAAFLLPILASLNRDQPWRNKQALTGPDGRRKVTPYALILAPTRELAVQIFDESKKFSNNTRLKMAILYGGDPITRQIRELERGCDVLVATPGRLVDVIERGRVSLSEIRFLVLDEADRMLDMGFEPQIRRIVEKEDMPPTGKRQTLMFSATFAKEIQKLAATFLYDYVFVTVGRVGQTTDLVTQHFIKVMSEEDKQNKLLDQLSLVKGLTLIFVETKKKAAGLDWILRKKGFPASSIHGDREQHERMAALRDFSSGKTPILIATNVAARGLDISNIQHVINYEMPSNIDDYVHRIGRTGRAGKTGVSTSFISEDNSNIIGPLIERMLESGLEVPSWLESMRPYRGGGGGYRGRGGYRGGRGGGGNRFGGKDYRYSNGPSNGAGSHSNGYSFAPPNGYQATAASSMYQQPYNMAPYSVAPMGYGANQYYQTPTNGYSAPAPSSGNSYQSNYSAYDSSRSAIADVTSESHERKRKPDEDYDSRDKYRKTGDGKVRDDRDYSKDRHSDRSHSSDRHSDRSHSSDRHDKHSSDRHSSHRDSHERSRHHDDDRHRSSSSSKHSSSSSRY